MSMGKRPRKDGEEMDVFGPWRYILGKNIRPGVTARVKKRVRRRERRQARQKGFEDQ